MNHYRLSPRANRDLDQIAEHNAIDRPDAAIRVIDAIMETIQFLAEFPRAGAVRKGLQNRLRTFVASQPAQKYVVIYREGNGAVEIVSIVHGARDWNRPGFEGVEEAE